MTNQAKLEQAEAITKLRDWIKPGDTVYTILDHVSSSGMSRQIRVVLLSCEGSKAVDLHPNYAVGKALGLRHAKRNGREQDALVVGGCGMDMGFHLVYGLSQVLYGGRLTRDIYLDSATHDQPGGQLLTREGAPADHVYIGGYQCLGKGKCPSNYHSNHRDTIHCPGTLVYNPDGPNTGDYCYRDKDSGVYVIEHEDHVATGQPERETCPTCKGEGRLPNPEGPERFDLVHTDGYALRHRWL